MRSASNSAVSRPGHLHGFFLGTRQALTDGDRQSITITIREISAFSIGFLIALFERAVGLYASLVNINAYHQPGVEAGKKAAAQVIELQSNILTHLGGSSKTPYTAHQIASAIRKDDDVEHVYKICEHLSANLSHNVSKLAADNPLESKFCKA